MRNATINFVMSVCPSDRPPVLNNSTPSGINFLKFDIWGILRKYVEKTLVSLKSD